MKLYLDTTDNLVTVVKLDEHRFVRHYDTPQQQDIVGALGEALESLGKTWSDITQVEVNPGPGSFTGVRVGVSVANAIAFANGIKVNGQTPPVVPTYGSEPHITIPNTPIRLIHTAKNL